MTTRLDRQSGTFSSGLLAIGDLLGRITAQAIRQDMEPQTITSLSAILHEVVISEISQGRRPSEVIDLASRIAIAVGVQDVESEATP